MSSFNTLKDFTEYLDRTAVPFPLKVMGEKHGPTATMLASIYAATQIL